MTVATEFPVEGKTKILRPAERPGELRVEFKDAATAFNGKKFAEIPGKGRLNAEISLLLFRLLEEQGVPTCLVGPGASPTELIYRHLTMIPLEVVVRNYALGSLVKRFGFAEGAALRRPLVEFFHKTNDDPPISEGLILEMELVPSEAVLREIKLLALQINEIFVAFFEARGIRCADFKLEFGLTHGDSVPSLVLGDELSPDNFRLRDKQTGAVLDKDVFRLDLADLGETYQSLLERMKADAPEQTGENRLYHGEVWVHSRKNILNPESKAILEGIQALGHRHVHSLEAGKRFVLKTESASLLEATRQMRALAETVLSNPVIEDYELRMKP